MQITSIEELWNYLENPFIDEPVDETEIPIFDNNVKALNVLFRNATNSKAFSTAFGIIVYANEHQITLTKGL